MSPLWASRTLRLGSMPSGIGWFLLRLVPDSRRAERTGQCAWDSEDATAMGTFGHVSENRGRVWSIAWAGMSPSCWSARRTAWNVR